MSKAFLTEIHKKRKSTECPIIVQFQNGYLSESSLQSKSVTCVHNNETNKKEILLAINNTVYQGTVQEDNEFTANFIAVRNKVTKKVRLIEVDQALLSNSILIEKNNLPPIKHYDAELAKKILLKNFGGKKASRYLERTERMKVNLDAIKPQLETATENIADDNENENENENNTSATMLNESSVKDIVPPFNKEAKNVDEVYNLHDLISANLLERLSEEANEVLVTEGKIPIPSEYLLNQIIEIRKSPSKNSTENMTKIKVYLYMDGLRNLLKSRARNMAKLNLSNITAKVENDIRVRFSPKDSAKSVRTAFSSDKALCYFIALALLMSPKYEIDINILVRELSKPRIKIVQYARYVNAKLRARSDILALGLPEPIKAARTFSRKK